MLLVLTMQWMLYRVLQAGRDNEMSNVRYICTKCGATMWKPKKISGMGCWVTILLFIAFLVTIDMAQWELSFLILVLDAIIYYCTLKKNCCPKCKCNKCVIPIDTPMGQKLLRDFKNDV